MPNCFSLTRKGETDATPLTQVDEELCKHLNAPCDPKFWVDGWYNMIGFRLAIGVPLDDEKMTKACEDGGGHLPAILEYLRTNFTSDCWYEHGR